MFAGSHKNSHPAPFPADMIQQPYQTETKLNLQNKIISTNTYEWANSCAAVVIPLKPPLSLTTAAARLAIPRQAPSIQAMPNKIIWKAMSHPEICVNILSTSLFNQKFITWSRITQRTVFIHWYQVLTVIQKIFRMRINLHKCSNIHNWCLLNLFKLTMTWQRLYRTLYWGISLRRKNIYQRSKASRQPYELSVLLANAGFRSMGRYLDSKVKTKTKLWYDLVNSIPLPRKYIPEGQSILRYLIEP